MTRCAGKTLKGEQCKNFASPGRKYCYHHRRQKIIISIGIFVSIWVGIGQFTGPISDALQIWGSAKEIIRDFQAHEEPNALPSPLATEQHLKIEQLNLEYSNFATATAQVDLYDADLLATNHFLETLVINTPSVSVAKGSEYGFYLVSEETVNYQGSSNQTPTLSPKQAVKITIPSLSVDAPIVLGDSWEAIKQGVGQSLDSVSPGEPGFIMLTAYNDKFGQIFRYLDILKKGDLVILRDITGNSHTYAVKQVIIVESEFKVQTLENEHFLLLVSWYPYLINDHYIVVEATYLGRN